MATKLFKLLIALCACMLHFSPTLLAQFEEGRRNTVSSVITGASLVPGAVAEVTYAATADEIDKKIQNVVTLKINENSTLFFKSKFTAKAYLKIETWASVNPMSPSPHTQFRTLIVNYDTVTGVKYDVRSYTLPVGERVKVTLDTFELTGHSGWDPKAVLLLENEMRQLRYYNFSSLSTDLQPNINSPANNGDALLVSWNWNGKKPYNNGCQLEWAWQSGELPAGYYANTDLLFKSNSTRVDFDFDSTGTYKYKIPLLYGDTGKLFYRIRASQRKNNGTVITGPWSTPQTFPAAGFFNGHENNLNWQASTSFAENAKLKTVVQYFDGTQRSRQTVTKDNSSGTAVVAESLYDLQGRPSIQILPAPTTDTVVKYFKDFNRFVGQIQINVAGQINPQYEDPAKYFDLSLDANRCNGAPQLVNTTGAGRYYSANNPWLGTANDTKSAYIPNANGYAYTETRYLDDATQRISRQGGVGDTMQIRGVGGHDTRYYYGKPTQEELDALFGTEVGYASHYSKNMVQDANGQMSVSYVDMHGRTIATALAGDSTPNLLAIYRDATSYPGVLNSTNSLTSQLITADNNFINGNAIEAINTILVPVNTTYNFTYQIDPAVLSLLNCNNQQVCFDCKYNLEISIRPEDCSNATPIVRKYNNLGVASCGSSLGFVGEGITTATKQIVFSQALTPGSWVIRKTLTINDSIFAVRKDSALKAFLCRTEKNLYDSIYNQLIGSTGCYTPGFNTTRPCDSCNANLGTYTTYRTRYLQGIGVATNITTYDADILNQFRQDSLACRNACLPVTPESSLQNIRNQMLADMIPYTGQYAIHKDSIKNIAGNFDPTRLETRFNIFTNSYTTNPGNVVTAKPFYYRFPKTELGAQANYMNEENAIDLTIQPTGANNDRSMLDTISADVFTNLYAYNWAQGLIYYHPEFSKLKFAENNLTGTYNWADRVTACSTYTEAAAQGYLTPLTSDPYFVNNYVAADKTNMTRWLTQNLGTAAETGKPSIWQIANGNVKCNLEPEYYKAQCIAGALKTGMDLTLNKDTVWEQFKSLYMGFRNEMLVNYINAQSGVLSIAEMQTLQNEKKTLYFTNLQQTANQNNFTFWASAASSVIDTAATNAAAQSYLTTNNLNPDKCTGQKPAWRAKLLQCEQLQLMLAKGTLADSNKVNNILNRILDSMVMVCRNSVTAQQPYGFSTTPPTFTGHPRSFESIIRNVFRDSAIVSAADSNYFCNPYSIDFPKPWGKNPPLWTNNTNIIDSCACKRFTTLKQEAKQISASYDTTSRASMNLFLNTYYKDSLTNTLWQALQKCNQGFYKDSCYLAIAGPGYPIATRPAAKPTINTSTSCPSSPVIVSAYYINTTTSVNNVSVTYSSSGYTSCTLYVYDSTGSTTVLTQSVTCGYNTVTLSLPRCKKYRFMIAGGSVGCGGNSTHYILPATCNACNPAPVINSVQYLNTTSTNNVQITYTSNAASTNCRIVAKNVTTNAVFTQNITCGSSSAILSLPACQAYQFRIFIELAGNSCYDSSVTLYHLPACTTTCIKIYKPIPIGSVVPVPAFLNCEYQRPCVTCTDINTQTTNFRAQFPGYVVPYLDTVTTTEKQMRQNSLWTRYLNYQFGFSKTTRDYLDAYKQCQQGITVSLCDIVKPLNDISDMLYADTTPCLSAQTQALFQASLLINQRRDSLIANFDSLYLAKCYQPRTAEQFFVSWSPKEYHYTLYYYDLAGNLVKTLPPAAVKPDYRITYLDNVRNARRADTNYYNSLINVFLATNYRYNSLNQVIAQRTPDAGTSSFWYDRLGRLAVSQNAQQKFTNAYSYTRYDWLGRITEVGQKTQSTQMTQIISEDTTQLKNWLAGGGANEQITGTIYDIAYTPIAVSNATSSGLWQQNLRNRVSFTYIQENPGSYGNWNSASFYSYDIHGNVDTLLQDYKTGMGAVACGANPSGNRYKKMLYGYDLISGKVNEVAYQPGQPDGYYHVYGYDAENRITTVATSRDKIYWEQDATYDYYRHGPLARTVLGQNKVQGLDYAYTLQGWLRGVNSIIRLPHFDIGKDGKLGANNVMVARDAFAYALGYYKGDYQSIGGDSAYAFNLALNAFNTISNTGVTNLFNGNISYSLNSLPTLDTSSFGSFAFGYLYRYDQLNRLISTRTRQTAAISSGSIIAAWPTPVAIGSLESLSYDPNGNILNVNRVVPNKSGSTVPTAIIDSLTYNYYRLGNGQIYKNQLVGVNDKVAPSAYNDIDNQTAYNYTYDAIGNLVGDVAEGISNITWTVYGKIKTITKTNGTTIRYGYDASGNRISKIVTTSTTGDSTYYVRDASGNTISVYNKTGALPLTQTEVHLYGSSRLAIHNLNTDVQNCAANSQTVFNFTRGHKSFELANHLGNVLVTVSDKKIAVDVSPANGTTDYYTADVITVSDYYPFGMPIPSRKYTQANSVYRYGFNGKENDDEITGEGNKLDFGARIYDSRLGRWLSTDIITKPYITPYNFSTNNPVNYLDPNGEDIIHFYEVHTRTIIDGKPFFQKTFRFSVVEKNNEPNVFIHHKVELRYEGIGATGKVSKQVDTRFYPDVPGEKSGLTTSYGCLKIKDNDRKTLIKFIDEYGLSKQDVDAGGGASGYTEVGSPGATSSDRMKKAQWWGGVFSEKSFKEQQAAEEKSKANFILGAAMLLAPELLFSELGAGGQVFYRTMTEADAAIFEATGAIPAGTETMISPTLAYAQTYRGVTFQINTKAGTYENLLKIGVCDGSKLTKPLGLPSVQSVDGWMTANAYFKAEIRKGFGLPRQINIGLGNGAALNNFNKAITSFKKVSTQINTPKP